MLATDTSPTEMPTQRNLQPFLNERASGVLLHVASLPSVYGIGDLGAAAYTLADRLHSAGQRYWQILPLNPSNPTSGESPYFSSSAFAGNPLLIDLEALVDWGYLSPQDLESAIVEEADSIDFAVTRPKKLNTLYK
ncbi:MAG: 4-alpha-glucanotransferase, partial [Aequoribacter sp.]